MACGRSAVCAVVGTMRRCWQSATMNSNDWGRPQFGASAGATTCSMTSSTHFRSPKLTAVYEQIAPRSLKVGTINGSDQFLKGLHFVRQLFAVFRFSRFTTALLAIVIGVALASGGVYAQSSSPSDLLSIFNNIADQVLKHPNHLHTIHRESRNEIVSNSSITIINRLIEI